MHIYTEEPTFTPPPTKVIIELTDNEACALRDAFSDRAPFRNKTLKALVTAINDIAGGMW